MNKLEIRHILSFYLKKTAFATFIVFTAFVPYGIRLCYYYFYQDSLPDFYQNECDLFSFCIAICLALYAENHNTESPFRKTYTVALIILPAIGLLFSFNIEHQKTLIENDILTQLKTGVLNYEDILCRLENYAKMKDKLFYLSRIACYSVTILNYILIVFKRFVK